MVAVGRHRTTSAEKLMVFWSLERGKRTYRLNAVLCLYPKLSICYSCLLPLIHGAETSGCLGGRAYKNVRNGKGWAHHNHVTFVHSKQIEQAVNLALSWEEREFHTFGFGCYVAGDRGRFDQVWQIGFCALATKPESQGTGTISRRTRQLRRPAPWAS